MTPITDHTLEQSTSIRRGLAMYWLATGLFAVLFLGSFLLTVTGPDESRRVTVFLDYPAWTVYPLAFAKLAGVLTILWGRWTTLKLFAFAGFLFDLILALGGHIAHDDPQGFLAGAGLVIWVGAFIADQKGLRHARTDEAR